MSEVEPICGSCNFCEREDGGKPFCWLKDLYTHVELDRRCDERDSRGRLLFAAESKKGGE